MGDRRDGTRLKSGGFEKIWNCLKSKRSENEVHMLKEIDVTELKKYYDEKKIDNEKLTYFHLFATAISKVMYNKPLLNRFVINGRKYERNDVTLSFVAKTEFTDNANELFTVVDMDNSNSVNDSITIHGILGSTFCRKAGFIIDYSKLRVYSK